MSEPAFHRTTSRILDILELISGSPEGMTFTEIVRDMDMPKSSLHPLLHTLNHRKYLSYNASLQKYFLGDSLFILGNCYLRSVDVLKSIQLELSQVTKRLDETCFLGIRRGGDVLYIAKEESSAPIRVMTASIGHQNPAYSTGLGKCLLLDFSLEELKLLYPRGLLPLTPLTITSFDILFEQLQQSKAIGYCCEKEESTPGTQCLAVPILHNGAIVASISVPIPVYRYSEEKEKATLIALASAQYKIQELIAVNFENWSRLCPAP
ncbi:IclR family transcriptional regulator [Oscillospiraceae bacterium MB08-C2-2]|nr:IclR family transcriptional regulator [Oscillospiraceae bacterium MB08-C2-2]